jgi:nucleotide-binding universal stress UspA family protein
MYTCIVVGTDGSATADKAVEAAASLAREWKAALHIVTAYRSGHSGMAAATGAAMADSGMQEGLRHESVEQIGKKATASWAEGIDVHTHAVADAAPDAILSTADKVGADLVVVGSKGMHGARRVLGSVPNSVAHGANCAVLIVKTD